MAKKKTKNKKEEKLQTEQNLASLQQNSDHLPPQAEEKSLESHIDHQQVIENKEEIDIHEAARRFVVGYKEHWYPSILRFANSQGYTGPTTPDECKRILSLWGAKLQ